MVDQPAAALAAGLRREVRQPVRCCGSLSLSAQLLRGVSSMLFPPAADRLRIYLDDVGGEEVADSVEDLSTSGT
jgi:hypothetical protein